MTKEDFESIYCQHYAKMYRLAKTMLYDADAIKDVVSYIFVRLLRDGDRSQKDKMESYLMTAVRNRCRDVLSHKTRLDFRNRNWKRTLRERIAGIGIGNGCGAVCNMAEQAFFT